MAINMIKRPIAQTEVYVSPLTLGTVKFGRNQSVKYPGSFQLPGDAEIVNLLAMAESSGISTLDTAPAYGLSEERIGKLLSDRSNWQIITKAGENFDPGNNKSHYDYSVSALEKSLESSLLKLNTDYIDCWMLHSDGNDLDNLSDEVIQTFIRAKELGLVRSIGVSTKTVAGGRYALEHFDCIMMTISLENTEEKSLFDTAKALGKSLFIKKIYDSGWALTGDNKQQIMQQTLRSIFQHTATCSAIIGTINPKHLQENIDAYLAVGNEVTP